MNWRVLVPVLLLVLPALPAQVPAHAVQLNPGASLLNTRLLRGGDTVHVIGITGGSSPYFVHHARSRDGGRTWPLREVPIGYGAGLGPCAVDGDHVHVAIDYYWLGPWVISSHDGGTTWSPPVRVSQHPTLNLLAPFGLHVHGNTVNVVWPDPRPGSAMWANRSLDGGLTWQPNDTPIDVGPGAGAGDSLQLLGEGPVLHAFWNRPAPAQIVHQRSLDGGASWQPAVDVVAAAAMRRAAGGGGLLVVGDTIPTTNMSAQLFRSLDQGTTWSLVTGHGLTQILDFAVAGQRVLAIGFLGPLSQFPVGTIQLNASADGGVTWWPVPFGIPGTHYFVPTAHVVGDVLFAHFRYPFLGTASNGTVIQSDDLGASWRGLAAEVGISLSAFPDTAIALTKTGWNGLDVQAFVLEGHTRLGAGAPGTAGLVPGLRGVGLPGLGRTFALEVGGARGGSAGAWFVTFGASANVPLGAATLYLQQPIGPLWFVTSGAPGAPGAGTASLPVPVPASLSFAGLRLLSQTFVLDAAAAGGFSATNAVETWLR